MGLVLGMLGGGGGILTVPILVGLFGMPAIAATGGSLLVVGSTALVGAIQGLLKNEADFRSGLILAVPSMAGAWIARHELVPRFPEQVGGIAIDDLLMGAFASLMVVVGWRMLAKQSAANHQSSGVVAVVGIGLAIGLVSGILGAGGGFLIVPALTLLLGMDLKRAIPTSLLVISLQSLAGFAGELGKPIEWSILLPVSAVALIGMSIGIWLRPRIPKPKLQRAFALLVFVVALWMIGEIFLNRN